jgi:hypothetical protein
VYRGCVGAARDGPLKQVDCLPELGSPEPYKPRGIEYFWCIAALSSGLDELEGQVEIAALEGKHPG